MGMFKAFFKGLFGDSPQKFIEEIMALYFDGKNKGYAHEESISYVIRSRYPQSDHKRKWIKLSLKITHNEEQSNEEALKGLVFTIWSMEMNPDPYPGSVPPYFIMKVNAQVNNDPIMLRFISDLDDAYSRLATRAGAWERQQNHDTNVSKHETISGDGSLAEQAAVINATSSIVGVSEKNDKLLSVQQDIRPSPNTATFRKSEGPKEAPSTGQAQERTKREGVAGRSYREGRFVAYDNGTVLDTWTNLMWAAKDNGVYIDWQRAKSYCENYRGGGYTDWRMPTQDELVGLCDACDVADSLNRYGYHINDLIEITGLLTWASETRGAVAATFSFFFLTSDWEPQSSDDYYDPQSDDYDLRALPVRNAK